MADPFELWLTWSTALSRGLERVAETILGTAALARRRQADAIDLSPFPVFGRVRIELATMLLLEPRALAPAKGPPILIVGPYAVHDASIADFAEGYSLAQVLTEAGLGFIGLTFWKSATAEMRDYGIDAYLSDLNVAIDDLGGRASLVGLCQGGWLAAAYAARFPGKVAKLVLVGAPIDLAAAEFGHHPRACRGFASDARRGHGVGRWLGFRAIVPRPLLGPAFGGIQRGSRSAVRGRRRAGRKVRRLERAHGRSARRLLPADGGMGVSRESAGARLFSGAGPSSPSVKNHCADLRPRGGRRRDRRLAAGHGGQGFVSRNQRRRSH